MKTYIARYKTPIGQLIYIEFNHDFGSCHEYFDAVDLVTNVSYLNLFVGYLVPSTIVEV